MFYRKRSLQLGQQQTKTAYILDTQAQLARNLTPEQRTEVFRDTFAGAIAIKNRSSGYFCLIGLARLGHLEPSRA